MRTPEGNMKWSCLVLLTLMLQFGFAQSMHEAARNGDLETVRRLVAEGIAVDQRDARGWTPLMFACFHGHESVIRFLLNKQSWVSTESKDGMTAFKAAVAGRQIEAFKVLTHRNMTNEIGLPDVARKLDWDMVKQLVEVNTFYIDEQDSTGETALIYAAAAGDTAMYWLLHRKGADETLANWDGATPLLAALVNGHTGLCDSILSRRGIMWSVAICETCNLDAAIYKNDTAEIRHLRFTVSDLNEGAYFNIPPLHLAAYLGRLHIVRYLVEEGAEVNHRVGGCTPLKAALVASHTEVIAYLRANGGVE